MAFIVRVTRERATEILNQYLPPGVRKITVLAGVHEGASGAMIWQVDIHSESRAFNGFAIAKFDDHERLVYEKQGTENARFQPVLKQRSPEVFYISPLIEEPDTDGKPHKIGFMLTTYAHDKQAEHIDTLQKHITRHKHARRRIVDQIEALIQPLFRELYGTSAWTAHRPSLEVYETFHRLINLGARRNRVTHLADRTEKYFQLFPTTQRFFFEYTGDGEQPVFLENPAYVMSNPELWHGQSLSVAPCVMHGDLHTANIICQVGRSHERPEQALPWLIDLGHFSYEGLFFYDLAQLELDILSHYLPAETKEDWNEWVYVLNHISTPTLNPQDEPMGERAPNAWQLIKPIRQFVHDYIAETGRNASQIDRQMQQAWWLAAVTVGLRTAQREQARHGLRSAGLVYSALALRHLPHQVVPQPNQLQQMVWQEQYGLSVENMAHHQRFAERRPVPLTRGGKLHTPHRYEIKTSFVGRADELTQLDVWAQSRDSILQVVAIGGQGKSALTWEWFNTHAADQIKDFSGGLWWSFYESDGAMSRFLENALYHLGRLTRKEIEAMSRQEREEALLALCQENTFLFVFDGLERILNAYRTETAATQTDDDVDVQTHNETPDMSDHPRACFNVQDAHLIRRLGETRAKVLISTRLTLRELEDMLGKPLSGVRVLTLKGLSDADALRLMHHYDIRGRETAMTDFVHTFEGHGLLLRLIIGKIRKHRDAGGNFDRWYEQEGRTLDLTTLDIRQKRTRVLEIALKALSADAWALLQRLAVYNYAFDFDAVMMIHNFVERYYRAPDLPPAPFSTEEAARKREDLDQASNDYYRTPAGSTEEAAALERRQVLEAELKPYEAWKSECRRLEQAARATARTAGRPTVDAALDELEDRGLISYDYERRTWDMHPVVRGEAYSALVSDGQGRNEALAGKRSYFERREKRERVNDIDDLRAEIEIYQAWLAEGAFDQAAAFYRDNIRDSLIYQLGTYHEIVRLLLPLFREGLDQPPALRDDSLQKASITSLANAYRFIDSSQEQRLRTLNIRLTLDTRDAEVLGVDLTNWSIVWSGEEAYASAIQARDIALRLAKATQNTHGIAVAQDLLFRSYADIGDWARAEATYITIRMDDFASNYRLWKEAEIQAYRAEIALAQGEETSTLLNSTEQLARKANDAGTTRHVEYLRGEAALRRGDGRTAAQHFETYQTLLQKVRLGLRWARGGLARALLMQRRLAEARAQLEAGTDDLSAAEVWLGLFQRGQADAEPLAEAAARRAYTTLWGEGAPYAHRDLPRAEAVLTALGVPVPMLPPYDESKRKRLPEEDRIIAFIEELEAKNKKKPSS